MDRSLWNLPNIFAQRIMRERVYGSHIESALAGAHALLPDALFLLAPALKPLSEQSRRLQIAARFGRYCTIQPLRRSFGPFPTTAKFLSCACLLTYRSNLHYSRNRNGPKAIL